MSGGETEDLAMFMKLSRIRPVRPQEFPRRKKKGGPMFRAALKVEV
jgi:hypothetical protein